MRGRFLAGFIFALALMTAWAGAIPFAQSAPVAVAYDQAKSAVAATTALRAPGQTFTTVARVSSRPAPARSFLRFDWRSFVSVEATAQPADPTPVPLSTPVARVNPTDVPGATPPPDPTVRPQATDAPDPTYAPDPTDRPDPTATPRPTVRPTDTPDPTAPPTPRPTASPTPRPAATATPRPTASATPRPTASPSPRPTAAATATPRPTASPTARPTATATPRPTASPTPSPTPTPAPKTYSGRSHFWFPALGIDIDWGWYGCEYGGPSTLPGGVWRWGCGPQNNIYLLSHAWSTFKKIKRAYNNGSLQVGQNVWYANAQGEVTKFEIKWMRRVTVEYLNATANEWALNDSASPIMTLQTCDGANNELRIIVRLVPA
jgi:hypothetical protein